MEIIRAKSHSIKLTPKQMALPCMFCSVLLRPWLEYSEYSALPTAHYKSILQEQHVKECIQRRVERKEQTETPGNE